MKNKNTLLLLALLIGIIIGAAIVWMLCNCCCKTGCCHQECVVPSDTTRIHRVSAHQANIFFKAYMNNPIGVDTVKAITINADQFKAMKLISKKDTSVHGFRIYMGMDKKNPVRMVVGTGSPDRVSIIYATSDVNSGLCPHVCDDTSPITDK